MEEMRKTALELAIRQLGKDAHNPDTVLCWADKFYWWLTQDGEASETHTVDPQALYGSKDVVNKAKLKEKLQERHDAVKGTKWFKQGKYGTYLEAIEDVLRIIDEA